MRLSSPPYASVAALEYRESTGSFPFAKEVVVSAVGASIPEMMTAAGPSEAEIQARLEAACVAVRAEAAAATETRLRAEWEAREAELQKQLACTLTGFAVERASYFRRVEAEVVQLALAIARKVLEREAEADPTLLGALVRIALDRMGAGPAVRLRVIPAEIATWHSRVESESDPRFRFELVGDPTLVHGDCVVETDLGSANFGFEAQLKEIEQGFFDLLAQRPGNGAGKTRAGQGRSGKERWEKEREA